MNSINSEQVKYNLLKGWMDCNSSAELSESIASTGRTVLIIDDNLDQYKDGFDQILGSGNIIEFFNSDYTLEHFRNDHDLSGCIARLKEVIFSCCLVISDLYLTEKHGSEFHSTPQNAGLISGFVLNKEIKKINPMLPVLMFTASNKVWNYRLFDSYGIDEWVVKFDAPFTDSGDSSITKSFFESFETAILNLVKVKPYMFLMDLYLSINALPLNDLWWDSSGNKKRSEVVTIVNESLLALKKLLNKQFDYEKLLADQNIIYDSNAYTCSAIIAQLGNIVEIIYDLYEPGSNRNADDVKDGINFFLLKNRNLAAHKHNFKEFTVDDVILELAVIEFMLKQQLSWYKFITDYECQSRQISNQDALLWNVILFYNKCYKLPKEVRKIIRERVKKYLYATFKDQQNGGVEVNALHEFWQRGQNERLALQKHILYIQGQPGFKLTTNADKLYIELSFP